MKVIYKFIKENCDIAMYFFLDITGDGDQKYA